MAFILYIQFILFCNPLYLHCVGTSQRLSLWCLRDISTGGLDTFAGFGLDASALSILAEGLIGAEFGYALGVALGIAVLDIRLDLSVGKGIHIECVGGDNGCEGYHCGKGSGVLKDTSSRLIDRVVVVGSSKRSGRSGDWRRREGVGRGNGEEK